VNANSHMSNFDPFAPNALPPSYDPFANNNLTSSGQPTSYQDQSQAQAQYQSPANDQSRVQAQGQSPTRVHSPSQLLVEYVVPEETQNQVQPHFQLGEQARSQARQQPQRPDNISQERGRTKSLSENPLQGKRKYRSARSVDSATSSRSNVSGYSVGQSPLDDPTFAPPPDPPSDVSYFARGRGRNVKMPSYDMVKHSGNAMARISLKSLIMKKWKPIFWICYGDSRVVVFRSKNDFEEWVTNPSLNETDRSVLVKLDVDFKNFEATKPDVRGYRAASLHLKDYGGKTGLMHTFKLEEWMYYGPNILGAFASKSRTDAHTFLVVLREIMKRHKQNINGYGTPPTSSNNSVASHRSTKSAPQRRSNGSGSGLNSRSVGSVNGQLVERKSFGKHKGMFGV